MCKYVVHYTWYVFNILSIINTFSNNRLKCKQEKCSGKHRNANNSYEWHGKFKFGLIETLKNWTIDKLACFVYASVNCIRFYFDWIFIVLVSFFLFFFDGRGSRGNACAHTVCNRTWFGEVGKTYELELDKPTALPFACHLNFTAAGGSHGDIIQVSKYTHLTVVSEIDKLKKLRVALLFSYLNLKNIKNVDDVRSSFKNKQRQR